MVVASTQSAPLRKRKTKTGCRTCKIRKVKCDETFPACNGCLNTGRTCDGYGIWGGGGGKGYEQRPSLVEQPPRKALPVKIPIPKARSITLIGAASPEEKLYFEFYKSRTANKLPPAFGTDFHKSVVLRASSSEPAVLHALLALSASHQRKELNILDGNRSHLPDEHEKFMLQQYGKAIQHLKDLPDENTRSLRTTLTACLVFIYIEYLRGDHTTAIKHLKCGLRLICEVKQDQSLRPKLPAKEVKTKARFHKALDDALISAFNRQHIVANYASRYDPERARLPSDLPTPSMDNTFLSIDEAVHYLKESFLYVENGVRELQNPLMSYSRTHRTMFEEDRPVLQGHLDFWINMYTNSLREAEERGDKDQVRAYKTLRPYQSLVAIIVATSLSAHTQMVFDEHTTTFLELVTQSIDLMESGGPCNKTLKRLYKFGWTDSKSIDGVGWIQPIYFTALKCRNHRIRHCAIKLLQLQSVEGTLEPRFARVAEEVVRLEEGDYFAGITHEAKVGAMLECHKVQEQSPLPESRRMVNVDVVLPKNGSDQMQLVCKRKTDGGWLCIHKFYDALSTRWVKVCPEQSFLGAKGCVNICS
ncbi:hypothetical protein DM02DRAFT_671591 [Periconia macrospinosa]|uniref:Zn(2)-C6 fungal-type domain-containing protein n=1 Tax=Periconia macrospinosa TaxID=97972 RepID=A0A2V1DUU8_9PLEO|nr:hypothetical protein DM02DRAFT_671591 [Periconia macrospinosa]